MFIFAASFIIYPFCGVGNNRYYFMKVKDLLCFGNYFADLQDLQANNLRGLCKHGLHVSLIREHDGDLPYCVVSSPCNGMEKVSRHICIFPVRDSMSICTVVNRVIAVIDCMGYIIHVKK